MLVPKSDAPQTAAALWNVEGGGNFEDHSS